MMISYNSKLIGLAQIDNIMIKNELIANEVLIHSSKENTLDELTLTFDNKSSISKILLAIDELKTTSGINEITTRM